MTWMSLEGESLIVKHHLDFNLIREGGIAVAEVWGVEFPTHVTCSIMK